MNVNLYVIEDYENESAFRPKKTNPIQTQTNPISKQLQGNWGYLLSESGFRLLSFSDDRPFALEIVMVNSLADKRFEVHPPEFPRLSN